MTSEAENRHSQSSKPSITFLSPPPVAFYLPQKNDRAQLQANRRRSYALTQQISFRQGRAALHLRPSQWTKLVSTLRTSKQVFSQSTLRAAAVPSASLVLPSLTPVNGQRNPTCFVFTTLRLFECRTLHRQLHLSVPPNTLHHACNHSVKLSMLGNQQHKECPARCKAASTRTSTH